MPISDAVTAIDRDMRETFGDRLRSVVAYAVNDRAPHTPQPTLVIVEALTPMVFETSLHDIPLAARFSSRARYSAAESKRCTAS